MMFFKTGIIFMNIIFRENRTSVSFTAGSLFEDELNKLRMKIAESRKELERKRRERDQLRSENENLSRNFSKYTMELKESCSMKCGLHYGSVMSFTENRKDDVQPVHLGNLDLGQSSRYNDFLKRIIKIRTEYEKK